MSSVNRWETCSNTFTRRVLIDLTLECDVTPLPRQHSIITSQVCPWSSSIRTIQSDLVCIACYNMNDCCSTLMLFLAFHVYLFLDIIGHKKSKRQTSGELSFFLSTHLYCNVKVCLPDAETQQQTRNRKGRHYAEHAAFQHPARLSVRPHTNSCISRVTKTKDLSVPNKSWSGPLHTACNLTCTFVSRAPDIVVKKGSQHVFCVCVLHK